MITYRNPTLKASQEFSLGILAGGSGQRWGGHDKGLLIHKGRPLIHNICLTNPPWAEEVLICCRGNPYFYQHYADRILCEMESDRGPCWGIVALLAAASTPNILILPTDLISNVGRLTTRLKQARHGNTGASVLIDSEGRASPCMRLSTSLRAICEQYIDRGGVKLAGLLEMLGAEGITVPDHWLTNANDRQALLNH